MNHIGYNAVFIGDIHGLSEWEQLCNDALNRFYDIVFLGDYVDSYFVKPAEQLYNLKNLCKFIRKHKKHTYALLGNHDYAYLYNIPSITGHQYEHRFEYRKIFDDNRDLFQIAWGYTNYTTKKYTLATHAGLTQKYYDHYVKKNIKEDENPPIHEVLNKMQDDQIIWKVGSMRGGMGTPGVLWADYLEVLEDPYTGINQVFGHTPRPTVTMDHIVDDFIVCIDDIGNKHIKSMMITL